MVHTTCAVFKCVSSSRINKELKFHQFPHTEERYKLWMNACKRLDLIDVNLDRLMNTYVCSLHFEKRMYGKKYLKKTAIPTLLLPATPTHTAHTQTGPVNIQTLQEVKIESAQIDVEELKKKLKNLNDTSRKELKEIPSSRSEVPASNIQMQWKYLELLEHLKDECMPTQGDSNLFDSLEDSTNRSRRFYYRSSENDTQCIIQISSPSILQSPPLPAPTTTPRSPPSSAPSPQPGTSDSGTSHTSRKRPNTKELLAEYLNIEKKKLKMLEQELDKQNSNTNQDQDIVKSDDYHFVMSILPEMKKLPPIQKMRLRNKINQAIMDATIATLHVDEPYGRYGFSTQEPSTTSNDCW